METFHRHKVVVVFNSFQFLFGFLPIALIGTFALARLSPGAAQLWLIAASLMFYGAWNVVYLPLLLASVLFNYLIARRMMREASAAIRTALLWVAVAVDLGLLGYYKYTGYFLETFHTLTGSEVAWASVILPLGISFYTFQQLTLLVDISSGEIETFRFRDFLLFVTFFPHLISGPIVHHREMMPQFQTASYRLNWNNLAIGFVLLAIGLCKKVILADGIARYVTPIFSEAGSDRPTPMLLAWAGAVGFTLQMYFDFSGYSEMALGLGRMVGIKLPMNFNSPLKALSIVEYWSRWHITLTRFLTAYVYNPIAFGAARRRKAAGLRGLAGQKTSPGAFFGIIAVPTLTTMFLSGLWHGAGNQFLIFGMLHGVALVANHGWRLLRPRFWADTAHYQRTTGPIAWLLTFLVAMLALVWFHARSVGAGTNIVIGLTGWHGIVPTQWPGSIPERGLKDLWVLFGFDAALLTIALVPPNTLELLHAWQPAINPPPETSHGSLVLARGLRARIGFDLTPAWALATGALLVLGVLGLNHVSEFLYWQF